MKNINLVFWLSLMILLSSACSEQIKQETIIHKAVAIESGDECHLCGMFISNFKGPKGEIFKKGFVNDARNKVYKFCSTRDLFSFYLDPENKRNVGTILVHDMSKMPWDSLKDEFFIDAKTAWFVSGSNKTGAMGKTLASFSQRGDAEAFGGRVLAFKEVTISVLM
jgi:copper chaperone NosL